MTNKNVKWREDITGIMSLPKIKDLQKSNSLHLKLSEPSNIGFGLFNK